MAKQVKDAGSAANTAARTGATRARRTVFGMACLCVLGLAAFAGSGAPSAGADTACPNESFRIAQHATQLPDCRAYEKVSPADKGNGDIVGDGWTTVAAVEGGGVAFNSRTPFGDTVGSGNIGQTQYLGRRTGAGWDVHGITPTSRPDISVGLPPTILQIYSDDLRRAVVRAYDLPGATDDAPLRNSLYVEDTATRALQTATKSQVDTQTIFDFLNWPLDFWAISADARHVSFVTPTQFLLEATPGVQNLYQWDDGVLHLAGILPGDTVAPPGGSTGPVNYRGAISADGSRNLFLAPAEAPNQLYQRIDNERTVWISEPEMEGAPEPAAVELKGATPDGKNVFFTTESKLLEADTNSGPDLYRWTDSPDPASEDNLTLISHGGNLGGAVVIGISDDGQRVYYQTGGGSTIVWRNGTNQPISSVALSVGDVDPTVTPGNARVTPDGKFLAFRSNGTIDDGTHGITGEVINNHFEMYLYSLADESLICVSCPAVPATSDVTVLPAVTEGLTVGNNGFRPRFLSDSGRIFFSTADALVAQDTNGVPDAYEYDPASDSVSLVSSGKGKDPATFADASTSGDDVFLVTRQRLVPSDQDELVDLYDVRVGGGFEEPVSLPPAPCSGDDCQGSQSAGPSAAAVGSKIAGNGNLHNRHCARHKRAVRRHGKLRCVRKHHRKHHQRANTNRRAGR
jgi:hypothetical protein